MTSKNNVKRFLSFDHVRFFVSNAKQTSDWFCLHFGFEPYAFKDRKIDSKTSTVSYVVKQNQIILVFESTTSISTENSPTNWLLKHGDSVHDVAFQVENLDEIIKHVKVKGAEIINDISLESDEFGYLRWARMKSFGDIVHTLIERTEYCGTFWPGYSASKSKSALLDQLPGTTLNFIDHVVGAQNYSDLDSVLKWYEDILEFHRFWSLDDEMCTTTNSAMKVVVMTNKDESFKFPLCEPSPFFIGRSQIQEFLDYNSGPGIQHIALNTDNILSSVDALTNRGVEFIKIPKIYYSKLRERLKNSKIDVNENLDEIEKLNVLLDYDEKGYLLQTFSKPIQDRPTLFLEIIQRHNHEGFGAGNIKALFEAVEEDQRLRGNLFD